MKTLLVAIFLSLPSSFAFAALDIPAIEQAAGAKGKWIEEEKVYKLSFPRDDVKVTVNGTALPPFMGLTSWSSFMSGREKAVMVMGDIVLFEDEVNPAMSAALENGLDVTALHNHFFYDEPRVFFMHIGGEGTADGLASGVRKVLDAVKKLRSASPQPAKNFANKSLPSNSSISGKPLDQIFGAVGTSSNGMYKAVFGREVSMPCACVAGKEMGVNTWAGFYGSDDNAIVDGDFACAYGELQSVLKTLRSHDINIVAIHNHMEAEAPRMLFLHYMGYGKAADLAASVKAALDAQKTSKTTGEGHHHHEQ